MAIEKRPVHKVQMTEGKRTILEGIIGILTIIVLYKIRAAENHCIGE